MHIINKYMKRFLISNKYNIIFFYIKFTKIGAIVCLLGFVFIPSNRKNKTKITLSTGGYTENGWNKLYYAHQCPECCWPRGSSKSVHHHVGWFNNPTFTSILFYKLVNKLSGCVALFSSVRNQISHDIHQANIAKQFLGLAVMKILIFLNTLFE